ncbi:MAG TPA: MerR family transcriptional regulator [Nitrospiria bacterium]|jgi:DNA-binding transcriptional MerR regulator|nr:MerR family transcriptional regulator [Nitrospiria bacterium]
MGKKTYSPKEICRQAKISARQLGYWKLIGIVRPGQELHGTRIFYRYTDRDLELLQAVQKLTEQGYLVSKAAEKIKAALAGGGDVSARTLVNLISRPSSSLRDPATEILKGIEDFQKRVEEERVRSRRFQYPLTCLAVKVEISPFDNADGVGEITRKILNTLNSYKRAYDTIAQIDSQEFLWLLCQTTEDGAKLVAQRIPILFPEREWTIGNVRYSIRINVGFATMEPSEEEGTGFVERARNASGTVV